MRRLLLLMAVACGLNFSIQAQTVSLEKTYEISGKAKRGYLGKVLYDAAGKTYTLIYVTKSTEKKVKFEAYKFDKDFNFISSEADEIEIDKARGKYTWFNFKGESYSLETISVSPNLTGQLVMKKKRITYSYNWFWGGYDKKVELLEKVKPKNEEGNKYMYLAHAEDEVTGDILVLVGTKDAKGGDPSRQTKDLSVLKFNKDFDMVKVTPVKFEFAQTVAFTRTFLKPVEADEEAPLAGMAFVFAPMGNAGMAKFSDPNKGNYTYVSVNENGELIDRVSFESPASYWKIDEMVMDAPSNSIFFFGPAAEGKDKYYTELTATTKFKTVQLLKISNHKAEYITSTNLAEMEAKLKTPPSQKKAPAYEGKKFDIKGYAVSPAGEFFIYGQNFDQPSGKPRVYRDVIGFEFDNKGVLRSEFGIDTKETNADAKANGSPQYMQIGKSGSAMYWILTEIDGKKEIQNAAPRFLIYPRIGKIDIGTGAISDIKDLGLLNKVKYYLDNKIPYLPVTDDNAVVFFGADKSGKVLYFAKVILD